MSEKQELMQIPNAREVEYKPGDTIIAEGRMDKALYLVKEGQVGIFKKISGGDKIPLGLVNSNEFIGEVSLLGDVPHSASAVALTPCKCIVISEKIIKDLMGKVPGWYQGLVKGLVFRLIKTNDLMKKHKILDANLNEKIQAISQKYNTNVDQH